MNDEQFSRRLMAILHADVVGYSRLIREDEVGTLTRLKSHRRELVDPLLSAYHGRLVKLTGDGALVEFPSVVEAMACAIAIQQGMLARNKDEPEDSRITFRIGVNLGDVIVDGDDIYGDGVNVAVRIEGLSPPNGVCVSGNVHDALGNRLPVEFRYLGEQMVKNIPEPVRVYETSLKSGAVLPDAPASTPTVRHHWRTAVALAVGIVLAVSVGLTYWWAPSVPFFRSATPELPTEPSADRPSIAVLPFNNLSGSRDQEYFADGITEDLTTDLSKISGLFVVSRNSSFAYKGTSIDIRQVSRELGVRYLLEGSVRRVGDQLRINAQLIDGTTGGHIWAERFDGAMADVFAFQDEVNGRIVEALSVSLTADDRKRLDKVSTTSPEAYDTLLRGLELYQRFSRESQREARELFKEAVELDPGYARAYANVALTYATEVNFGWTEDREESVRLGLEYAARALELDDRLPQIYLTRAALYLAQRRYDAAIEASRRTIEMHPNYADGHASLAFVLSYSGHPEEALEAIRHAKSMNPHYSHVYLGMEGRILFLLGRYDEAATLLEESTQRNPWFDQTQLTLAATYAQLGNIDDAAWAVEQALMIRPDISLERERREANYRRAEDTERYIDALRKAGVPER